MRKEMSFVLLAIALATALLIGCNRHSTTGAATGGSGGGNGGDSNPPNIVVNENDLELTDPNSNHDGIAAPGKRSLSAFRSTTRATSMA